MEIRKYADGYTSWKLDRIIRHLKISFHAERPPPPPIAQHELLLATEEMGEYF